MKKIALLLVICQLFSIAACSIPTQTQTPTQTPPIVHTHTVGEEYLYDNQSHWHQCTACHEETNVEAHVFSEWAVTGDTEVRTCFCGYTETKASTSTDFGNIEDTSADLFLYEENEDGITILKYVGADNYVQIPSELDGVSVVRIATGAFTQENISLLARKKNFFKKDDTEENQGLGVYIPDSVEHIEEGAFPEDSVFISNAQGKKEGWKDSNLKGNAESESGNGGNIYFMYDKKNVWVEGGMLFIYYDYQQGYYLAKCLKQKKNVVIPAYVKGQPVVHIGQKAFYENTHLESVVLPETIAFIFHEAFKGCTSLREIICNSTNLSQIRAYAFAGCTALEEVVLPPFLTYLESCTFEDCGTIKTLTVPSALNNISGNAFSGTTIEKIDYLGTEENFNNIKITARGNEGFTNAEVSFLPPRDTVIVNDLKEINNVEYGSIVQVEGYVASFAWGKYIILINDDNSFGIQIYKALYRGDLPPRYAKVRITGTWTKYTGQDQISLLGCEIIEENAMDVSPIPVTIEDLEKNPELYYCRHLIFTGSTMESTYVNITFLARPDGSKSKIYIYGPGPGVSKEPITFIGTLIHFNHMIQLQVDRNSYNP